MRAAMIQLQCPSKGIERGLHPGRRYRTAFRIIGVRVAQVVLRPVAHAIVRDRGPRHAHNLVVGRISRLEGESTVPGDDRLGNVSKRIIAGTDECGYSPPPRNAPP
jgi:hypothetical protein